MRAKRKCVQPKEKEGEEEETVKKSRARRQFSMNAFLSMSGILGGFDDDPEPVEPAKDTTSTTTTAALSTTESVTLPSDLLVMTTPMVTLPIFTTPNATDDPFLDDLFATSPLPLLETSPFPPLPIIETTASSDSTPTTLATTKALETTQESVVEISIELEEEICDFPGYWKVVNETEKCNTDKCPGWAKWSDWDICTVTCGTGSQRRTRECRNGEIGVSPECFGDHIETKEGCNDHRCPFLTEWGQWSKCSVTCGGADRVRSRDCMFGVTSNIGCRNGTREAEPCNTKPCPIYWSEWTNWSGCSEYCGDGERTRTRICQNETPLIGCDGNGTHVETCNEGYCEGGSYTPRWAQWGEWTTCSTTCGVGSATRERECEGNRSLVGFFLLQK